MSLTGPLSRWAVAALCAWVVAAPGVALGQDRWPIEWIELEGDFERVTAEQVRTAVMPYLGGGFFAVNVDDVVNAVAALDWISAAAVRKVWPDRVVVRVVEHQPVARWNEGALIGSTGQVFRVPEAGSIRGLPALSGDDQQAPQVVDFLHRMKAILRPTGLDVTALGVTDRGAWSAQLTGGLKLQLGRVEPLTKAERFAAAYAASLGDDPRPLISADMRYPNGMAVRWGPAGPDLLAGNGAER